MFLNNDIFTFSISTPSLIKLKTSFVIIKMSLAHKRIQKFYFILRLIHLLVGFEPSIELYERFLL